MSVSAGVLYVDDDRPNLDLFRRWFDDEFSEPLELCTAGEWANTFECVDPDICEDGATSAGTTSCGLNGRGHLNRTCDAGQWRDVAGSCVDPDSCEDGVTVAGTTSCGLP